MMHDYSHYYPSPWEPEDEEPLYTETNMMWLVDRMDKETKLSTRELNDMPKLIRACKDFGFFGTAELFEAWLETINYYVEREFADGTTNTTAL